MDSFSRLALHEMTHYSSVGPKTSLADQIINVKNADGEPAYDPERVHGLLHQQDDQPGFPEINADSYAWMSLDAWISRKCAADMSGNNWASLFTQDPTALLKRGMMPESVAYSDGQRRRVERGNEKAGA